MSTFSQNKMRSIFSKNGYSSITSILLGVWLTLSIFCKLSPEIQQSLFLSNHINWQNCTNLEEVGSTQVFAFASKCCIPNQSRIFYFELLFCHRHLISNWPQKGVRSLEHWLEYPTVGPGWPVGELTHL